MVYTDGVHLVADTFKELHEFAVLIGLKKEWFQNNSKHPHYDLMGSKRMLAVNNGALVCDSKMIVEICNKNLVSKQPT